MSIGSLPARFAPPPADVPQLPRVGALDLYGALLADARSSNTRASRVFDCRLLARFLGTADPSAAVAAFVGNGRGAANAIGLALRRAEIERGQSPASINRLNAHLRRLCVLARKLDLIEWCPDLDDLPAPKFRDTEGPGREGWERLWDAGRVSPGLDGLRVRAVLRLLYDLALRRAEVCALDVADVDLGGSRVAVRGKGKSGAREWMTCNTETRQALREWLLARGPDTAESPAVFVRLVPGARDTFRRPLARLGDRSLNRMLVTLSDRAGLDVPARPHGLRHQAITRALDLTNGNVRMVQQFARHGRAETTILYDDSREDMPGIITRLLGGEAPEPPRPATSPGRFAGGPTDAGIPPAQPLPRRTFRRRTSCRAKLDDARVLEARTLYAREGWRADALAEKYGVHRSTMMDALEGRTWSHVPTVPRWAD